MGNGQKRVYPAVSETKPGVARTQLREVHQRPRNCSKHGSGTCATRSRTMQSADNNFFQLRGTFNARTPPRRTPTRQSTRFCLDTWRVYPAPSTLIIIHPDLSWRTPDCVQKAPVCVRLHRRQNAWTRHHPPIHRTAQHTHTRQPRNNIAHHRGPFPTIPRLRTEALNVSPTAKALHVVTTTPVRGLRRRTPCLACVVRVCVCLLLLYYLPSDNCR